MQKNGIEFRRGSAGGGNQMRQPYLNGIIDNKALEQYPEVEHIHHFGWYIGNYSELNKNKIHILYNLNYLVIHLQNY